MIDPATFALAQQVLAAARAARLRLGTAESCTGGMIAAALTDPAGASDAFDLGLVTYFNEAKTALLGVPAPLIGSRGAVSREVATAMVAGLLERHPALGAGVAVTGIAGPGGGSEEKPVGLVYIASARRDGAALCTRNLFPGGRDAIRRATVSAALSQLLTALR